MLTESQKAAIIAEEKFRTEVRQQLAAAEPVKRKSWATVFTFFNSAFGLWLLSAIFITGGVKVYEEYKAKKDDRKKSSEAIERLDLEIGFRFSHIIIALDDQNHTPVDTAAVSKIYYSMGGGVDQTTYLYLDYKNYNLLSLLAEEHRLLVHEDKTDDQLDRVMGHLSGLKIFRSVRNLKLSDPAGIAKAIHKDIYLGRWRGASWYYSEGSEQTPFP